MNYTTRTIIKDYYTKRGMIIGAIIGAIVLACSVFLWTWFVLFPQPGYSTGWSGIEPVILSAIALIFGLLIGGVLGAVIGAVIGEKKISRANGTKS